MKPFNDIFIKIDSKLSDYNFYEISDQEKIELVNYELKRYLINKVKEISDKDLSKDINSYDAGDLFFLLSLKIDKKDYLNTLDIVIHYILNISSIIQGQSIVWYVEEDETLINNPVIRMEEGMWDSLVTHIDTSRVATFEHVYDTFLNNFIVNEKSRT